MGFPPDLYHRANKLHNQVSDLLFQNPNVMSVSLHGTCTIGVKTEEDLKTLPTSILGLVVIGQVTGEIVPANS